MPNTPRIKTAIIEPRWVCERCGYTPEIYATNQGQHMYRDNDALVRCPIIAEKVAQGVRPRTCPHLGEIRGRIVA